MKIGIIGTGSVGRRLQSRFIDVGHDVVAGARKPAPGQPGFRAAAAHGELVVLAIPFSAAGSVLAAVSGELAGKPVIDATNPLGEDWSPLLLEDGLSAGETIQRALPEARVVKAFNTIFADAMLPREGDSGQPPTAAFLCGDDAGARSIVATLARELGFSPVDAGPLRCARYLEAMAHLNIQIAVGMGGGTGAVFGYHRPTDFIMAEREQTS